MGANPGDLSRLARELWLSGEERRELAFAYAYERDYAREVGSPTSHEQLVYLTERVGVSREEAERVLADSDLFLTDPSSHYGFAPDEAVGVWSEAERKLDALAQAEGLGAVFDSRSVEMLLFDASTRATEQRKRAEERVERG